MRTLAIVSLVLAGLPATALAQTRTAEEYVCALTDECADAAAPAATGQRGNARTSDTRGFSLTRPTGNKAASPTPARRAGAAPVRPKQAAKSAAVNRDRPAAAPAAPGQERRVDLRLSFKLGSAELTEQAKAEARVFAQALKLPALASRKFVIEGHTDAQGGRAYNLDLSKRRARAVADFLAGLGVERNRFEVRGFGFDRPLPGRSAASGANRRVEAVLIS